MYKIISILIQKEIRKVDKDGGKEDITTISYIKKFTVVQDLWQVYY